MFVEISLHENLCLKKFLHRLRKYPTLDEEISLKLNYV